MACVLFNHHLLLATANRGDGAFTVAVLISLEDLQILSPQEGKGIWCRTVPFAWKIAFKCDQMLHEILLCACSAKEEEAWRGLISERRKSDNLAHDSPEIFTLLTLDIKPTGYMFGLASILARQSSTSEAEVSTKDLEGPEVNIKNTFLAKEGVEFPQSSSSQQHRPAVDVSSKRTTTLTPKRIERGRIENALSDVWTKEILPFPCMAMKRGENVVRVSASSMMRKLSIASIATTFTKRSTSYTLPSRPKTAEGQRPADTIHELTGTAEKAGIEPARNLRGSQGKSSTCSEKRQDLGPAQSRKSSFSDKVKRSLSGKRAADLEADKAGALETDDEKKTEDETKAEKENKRIRKRESFGNHLRGLGASKLKRIFVSQS
ncbi:hypothetical protein L228DRAFT_92182 [Xylona heveae TC161]|uniref:PH domain-containing protein n=1 Tax=Xylona heveae (strain CBS 132557 / TC161) TaxID=1328760 RepID=A0A165I1T2_XYLHT|nr:hypothetical protein L228DRAFT_92182 [Xylona heveae TC161]KZF24238.1 hypothetical protein L228DRAFT_92182 [Xylona heveae TC161]